MIQLFKIVNNIDSVEAATWFQVVNITRPNTRAINHNNGVINFHIQVKRTEISKNFFSVRAAIYWNNLPDNVKQAQTLPVFKKRLDKYLETLA